MNKYKFWAESTGIKALKTGAQSLVALLGATAFNVVHIPWADDLGIAAGAALVCILHNINSLPGADTPAPAPAPEPNPQPPTQ